MPAGQEVHAHGMTEAMRAHALAAALREGVRIAAIIVDQKLTRETCRGRPLPKPGDFHIASMIAAARLMSTRYQMAELRIDEDVSRKARRQTLPSAIRADHRILWPASRLRVSVMRSHSSDLCQVADVIAYCLGQSKRGTTKSEPLVGLIEALVSDASHELRGPMAWEP